MITETGETTIKVTHADTKVTRAECSHSGLTATFVPGPTHRCIIESPNLAPIVLEWADALALRDVLGYLMSAPSVTATNG